ncbi:MAG: alpha-galactosidase, partial [Lentisphaeria bacterium]|nr:alpha-galactosidase [Lentisphaeria bacterium]
LSFHTGDDVWSVVPSRDSVPARPALLDTQGNVQGYLAISGSGDRLKIRVVHRTAQFYEGALRLEATVTLGESSFACRTTTPAQSDVVQMGTGAADSGLNDSVFDVETDTALRFEGASIQLATMDGTFALQASANIHDASCAAIILCVERDYYRSQYAPSYTPIDRARCPSPPTGWMSWNVYFDQAGAEENLAEARVGAKHLKPFGMEFWSIESWQANSDTLPVRNFHNLNMSCHPGQFPEGMKHLADDIRALGFRPGIWTAPFGTGSEEFYEEHREWFLHDSQAKPMMNWCGQYLLDPSQPEVRDHMREMHRRMAREWGYEFFKIDGMSGRGPGYSAHFF